ncbi:MAG TPA: SRPBCC family protein [Thermoplasmata archaeon]|nr:SRPBCC family protein [Thermoplasmata archaeon]
MPFELSARIDASPDRVFAVLTDLRQAKDWLPSVQKIDEVSPGSFGTGTSWRETRQAGKRIFQSTIRVTEYKPASTLSLVVDGKGMTGQLSFRLAPKDGGTDVHYVAEMKGKGLMRLMTGTINRMMAAEDADLLDRLRDQVRRSR